MILNTEMILSLAGAGIGFLGLMSALLAIRAVHGWRAQALSLESSLAALRRELELLTSVSVKAGRRVARVEQQYSGVADRVDQVEMRGPVQSYDQAIDFARRGADTDQLTQQFGLSRSEADLVTRLHGRKKTA